MTPFLREDWYLASLGRTLIWARPPVSTGP